MRTMHKAAIVIVVGLVTIALIAGLLFLMPSGAEDITMVSINDLHGALLPEVRSWSQGEEVGGIACIAGYIGELREENPNTMVIDVGDAFQGRPVSNLFYGESVVECYNAIGVDALVIGNHEFDWGKDALVELMDKADFPFLSANVLYEGEEFFEPYIIKEIGGRKVQIIGVTTELTPEITEKRRVEDFQFIDAADAVRRYYNSSCDLVVVAGHMGVEDENAEGFITFQNSDVPVDIFFGGHTHEKANWSYGGCTFVEAYSYGTAIGVVNITETDRSAEVINIGSEYEDEMIEDIVEGYYERVEEEMEEVIAFSPSSLRRESSRESALGNWMCDVIKQAFGVDVVLMNSGGIRADLERGEVTVGDIYTIMPFDNTVFLVEMTGAQIKEALEVGAATDESGKLLHGIVQVSGVKFTYDIDAPNGEKVKSIYVDGKPIDMNKLYSVATNSFMAGGGDGYYVFEQGRNLVDTGLLVRDPLLQNAESEGVIEARVEGRIRAL
jgi:2',3'-cyclic-nucleotide 2'-phosphodiesterase (5'-nucleotidase family)